MVGSGSRVGRWVDVQWYNACVYIVSGHIRAARYRVQSDPRAVLIVTTRKANNYYNCPV